MARRTRGDAALIHTPAYANDGKPFAAQIGYAVHDPERYGYVVATYFYRSREAAEAAAFNHAAGINAVREEHNAQPMNARQMQPVTVVEYLGYWNGRPA